MQTAVLSGVSSFPVDNIMSSVMPSNYRVEKGTATPKIDDRRSIVTINLGPDRGAYPRWLKLLALVTILLTAIGFIAGVITPGAVAGILFPTGLVGVWAAGRIASRRKIAS